MVPPRMARTAPDRSFPGRRGKDRRKECSSHDCLLYRHQPAHVAHQALKAEAETCLLGAAPAVHFEIPCVVVSVAAEVFYLADTPRSAHAAFQESGVRLGLGSAHNFTDAGQEQVTAFDHAGVVAAYFHGEEARLYG